MKYRAEIDGLRALAVLPVILFHAGFSLFGGGYVGVDVFFVISGFLITTIIVSELEAKTFSLAHFYERRARRILPALYFTVLLASIGAALLLLPNHLVDFGESIISIPIFASNLYFWFERGYFSTAAELRPMIHTWSLAVEEQFYLLYPLFLMMFFARKHMLRFLLVAGFIVSMIASWYLTKLHFETAFYLPLSRAWELLSGAFVAWLLMKNYAPKTAIAGDAMAAVGLTLIIYAVFMFDEGTMFPSLNAAFPVFGTALILYGTTSGRYVKRILSFKPFVAVGLWSYSLYLLHQPLFALTRHEGTFEGREYYWIALCLGLAFVSYRFVERPFRDKGTFNARQILRYALLSSVAVMAVGAFFVKSEGLINRYPPEDQRIIQQFIELDGYNQRRFDAAALRSFESDGRRKILLVGDSFAKDFMNIVYEGGYERDFDFSTKQINAECGNLYLESYDEITEFIREDIRERCKVLGRFEGDRVKEIAHDADEIWLVGHWKEWVVPYLPQTIDRLETEFDVKVRVFGIKHFGKVRLNKMLSIPFAERARYIQPAPVNAQKINGLLSSALGGDGHYYEIMKPMCGGDIAACKIFTGSGALISPDGGHLTREGAVESAKRLEAVFADILGDDVKR